MKTNLKALCATGLLAATMTAGVMLPGQAAEQNDGQENGRQNGAQDGTQNGRQNDVLPSL